MHTGSTGARCRSSRAARNRLHDFYFFTIEEPEKVVEKIVYLCKEGVPSRFGFDPVNDIQVLTPMHKGTVGVASLNAELQRSLNPSKDELIRGGKVSRTGDKVLQIRNNYDKDVFNGDIGRIREIDREVQELRIDFDGRLVSYEFSELDEVVLAYATSVHKSQGSEILLSSCRSLPSTTCSCSETSCTRVSRAEKNSSYSWERRKLWQSPYTITSRRCVILC